MMDNPTVSIITPVLNGRRYLESCVQSVLNQNYPNIEHIFVDGGSTDGSLDILRKYIARFPDRVRLISEPDRGIGDAMSKGLKMARGEILCGLGTDDLSEPRAIRTVVEFFKNHPDAYFVYGECNIINEEGEAIDRSYSKDFNLKTIINRGNYVSSTSSFYRREVLEKVGFHRLPKKDDLDFLIRAGMNFKLHRIYNILSNFRKHEGSETTSKRRNRFAVYQDYVVSRRYGGGIFSGYGIHYYLFPIIETLFQPKNGRFGFVQRMVRWMFFRNYL
jgi:glycosyltransferase involved in cell wall biosynthesis